MSRYIDADAIQYDEDIPDIYTVSKTRIDNMPSADVRENVRGNWTRKKRIEPVYDIDGVKTWGIKCQCCKCDFSTIVVENFGYYQFCPNCGADMRGE